MAIKLGEQNIGKIMLGDRPIKKVMLGDRLVFHKDFDFLDSVESTGEQWIDTNYKPIESGISLDFDIALMGDDAVYAVGCRHSIDATMHNSANILWNNGKALRKDWNLQATQSGRYFQKGVRYNVKADNKILSVNDAKIIDINQRTGGDVINATFHLFASKSFANGVQYVSKQRFWRCVINNNNDNILDLIPCQNKTTKEIGMYDKISGQFFGNSGSGQFFGWHKNGDIALPLITQSFGFSHIDFSLENAIKILDALQPVTTAQTITFSAYTTTLINESDVALGKVFDAIRKGWSIVGDGLIQTDDVAFFNDSETRMPTRAEFEELLNNTTKTNETISGINGVRFTANNGNSIFLPFGGNIVDTSRSSYNSALFYNSSDSASLWGVNYFYASSTSEPIMRTRNKFCGHSVRAVSATKGVDLGLSVKWAECNIGATQPHEIGGYYAWGELSPKTNYSWSTYKFNPSGDGSHFTKYNNTDGLTRLQIKY